MNSSCYPVERADSLRDLVYSFPAINFNGRVGVIAPYRNQIKVLQKGMWKTGLRQDGVEISTVDGFQGRQDGRLTCPIHGFITFYTVM